MNNLFSTRCTQAGLIPGRHMMKRMLGHLVISPGGASIAKAKREKEENPTPAKMRSIVIFKECPAFAD